jgi:hypothetical protein
MSRIERRLEPGQDIAPLTVVEFDQAHDYLRAQVAVHLPAYATKAPNVQDDLIKEAILNDPACPEYIKTLSLDRPTVFDILCSHTRYKPEMIAIQRGILEQVQSGRMESSKGYYEVFKKLVPNSNAVLQGLRQQAQQEQAKSAQKITNVNFQ